MPIALKSVTAGTNNGSSATVSVTTSESPSATAVGDLVVVIHANDYYALSNMPTPTATGSPTLTPIVDADAGSPAGHLRSYWYVANTAGAQTIQVTETGSADEEKFIVAFVLSGANTTTPIDGSASNFGGATTSQVAPAISPTSSDAYAIVVVGSGGGAATTAYTTPSPLTEHNEAHVGGLSGVWASAQLAASGSTGTFTFTAANSVPYTAVTIGIATAGGGSPAVVDYAAHWNQRPPGRISPAGRLDPWQGAPATTSGLVVPAFPVVTETDQAVALGRSKAKALPTVTETDSTVALARVKSRAVPTTTETDSTVTLGRTKTKAVGIVTETDATGALGRTKQRTLGLVTEADTATALGRLKARTLAVVSEASSAIALGRAKSRALPQVGETDTVGSVVRAGGMTQALPTVSETDSAVALGRAKRKTAPVVTEGDSTVTVGRTKQKSLPPTSEADTPVALTSRKTKALPVVSEVSAVVALVRRKARALAPVVETGSALLLGRRKSRTVPTVAEVDTAGELVFTGPTVGEPAAEVLVVAAEDRTLVVERESRTLVVEAEGRRTVIPRETRHMEA